jgi:hypothetical protein
VNFDAAERIAAAILYEGYILYPYRPTAIKNRQRWNFGTLYPRVYAEAQRPQEPFRLAAECLALADASASLDVRMSFLQLVPKQDAHSLTDPSLAWDEAVERTSDYAGLRLGDLITSPPAFTIDHRIEMKIAAELFCDGVYKLHLEVENASPLATSATYPDAPSKRDEVLPLSLVSAHLLLGISGGEFVSLLDPEPVHREAAAACCNSGVFPVLVGDEPDRSMMFFSPIILYDYPKIAPESEGDFFDGTEMDEMLTLRVLTLTDAEKEEMRQGDARGRKILERTEALAPESLKKVHGIIRGLREIRDEA